VSTLSKRQNSDKALELLYIQRKLYDRSKHWGKLRIIGVLILGIASPVITFFLLSAAFYIAAVSAVWLTLSRTWFANREKTYSRQAALIQNEFDCLVFGIENNIRKLDPPTLEERADLLPSKSDFDAAIDNERLRDWYPLNTSKSDALNTAVAQRANAAYTDRLLRANSSLVLTLTILWLICIVAFGIYRGLSSANLVLGIIIPILPGLLDNFENWLNVINASKQRRSLAKEIEDVIINNEDVEPHIEHWQQRTFELRLTTPYLPNILYGALRDKNEAAMNAVADNLFNTGDSHGKH